MRYWREVTGGAGGDSISNGGVEQAPRSVLGIKNMQGNLSSTVSSSSIPAEVHPRARKSKHVSREYPEVAQGGGA